MNSNLETTLSLCLRFMEASLCKNVRALSICLYDREPSQGKQHRPILFQGVPARNRSLNNVFYMLLRNSFGLTRSSKATLGRRDAVFWAAYPSNRRGAYPARGHGNLDVLR